LRNIAAMLKGIVLLIPSCERYSAGASVEETKAQSFSQPSPFAIAKCQRQVTARRKKIYRSDKFRDKLPAHPHSLHEFPPPCPTAVAVGSGAARLVFSTRALSYPSRATPTRFPV
jgi:hypothetical protein